MLSEIANCSSWLPYPFEELSAVVRAAIAKGLCAGETRSAVFYSLDGLTQRLSSLAEAFPPGSLHAVAIKANPVAAVVRRIAETECGVEAASLPELELAVKSGVLPERIVYNSPVKTEAEIRRALQLGVRINIDSFGEFDRIRSLLNGGLPQAPIGFRVNPEVGVGAIVYTSTAGRTSKFGVSISGDQAKLIETYKTHPWLSVLHIHVGSQTIAPEMLAKAAKRIVELAEKINAAAGREQISIIDIGGGLPAQYHRGERAFSPPEYAVLLKETCPQLFSAYKVVTEFGRVIHANLGFALSVVEYVKPKRGALTAMIHLGADMFIRECYRPDDWHHDLLVLDQQGEIKRGPRVATTVAGPLCFSGDMLAHDLMLPQVEPGDLIVICDSGAYTLGMWSRYNSRQVPAVIGYEGGGEEFAILKNAETVDDVLRFWS